MADKKRKQTPEKLMPKLFGELRERYADRQGGYTRVLLTEPHNKLQLDQAKSAVLIFVDGPKDTRFAMTAAAVARDEVLGKTEHHKYTLLNMKKVTAFRKNGEKEFRELVEKIKKLEGNNFKKQEAEQAARPYREGW